MTEHGLSREEIVARNIAAVEAHFHNETPENVDKAIALYDENEISWEGPSRGVGLTDHETVRAAYVDIFKTVKINKSAVLRQFATEQFVFHDEVVEVDLLQPTASQSATGRGHERGEAMKLIGYLNEGGERAIGALAGADTIAPLGTTQEFYQDAAGIAGRGEPAIAMWLISGVGGEWDTEALARTGRIYRIAPERPGEGSMT